MPDGVLEIRERGGVGNLELSYQNHNQIHFVCKTPLKFCYLTFTTGISVGFSISISYSIEPSGAKKSYPKNNILRFPTSVTFTSTPLNIESCYE